MKGVLLVGHGTRDENGTREFFELANRLGEHLAPMPVQGCLLEFQHPTIPEAWDMLVNQGVTDIHVAPLLLFAAGHARDDIPNIVSDCASRSPHVRHQQSGPLSRSPGIIKLLVTRILEALAKETLTNPETTRTALVTVGRGSHHPCATADMRILGEIVAHRSGFQHHLTAFYAMAEPRLPDILDEAANKPSIERVIVQPHLLFQGRLYDAIARQVDEARERNRSTKFTLGNYLGPTPEVAGALSDRIFSPWGRCES